MLWGKGHCLEALKNDFRHLLKIHVQEERRGPPAGGQEPPSDLHISFYRFSLYRIWAEILHPPHTPPLGESLRICGGKGALYSQVNKRQEITSLKTDSKIHFWKQGMFQKRRTHVICMKNWRTVMLKVWDWVMMVVQEREIVSMCLLT